MAASLGKLRKADQSLAFLSAQMGDLGRGGKGSELRNRRLVWSNINILRTSQGCGMAGFKQEKTVPEHQGARALSSELW